MEYICPRCKRPAVGWPLRRPDICSPADWVNCIRIPQADWGNWAGPGFTRTNEESAK